MHAGMSGEGAQKFKPFQASEAALLLRDLLKEDRPMARYSHFRRCVLIETRTAVERFYMALIYTCMPTEISLLTICLN